MSQRHPDQISRTPDSAMDAVVSVQDLEVEFPTAMGVVRALHGVTFDVPRGKILGIVGESGCGKSVTSRAIMQIIEQPGRITGGRITFQRGEKDPAPSDAVTGDGAGPRDLGGRVDITALPANSSEMRAIRGKEIAMIFQEPMSSLNPVYTISNQIEEAILLHQTRDKAEARRRSIEMLRRVGMPNPEGAATAYPHQLSGGMRQRAMIAMALSCHPTLLIADEPTTALDVTTEAQILELLRQLNEQLGMSIMFITHSMGVIAQLCDEVIVMYLGAVVERASVDEIFYNPKHPYTRLLLRSIPRIGSDRKAPLEVIKGSVPDPYTTVRGCPFHPRCPDFMPGVCDTIDPAVLDVSNRSTHTVRCHLYDDAPVASTSASEA